MASTVKSHTRTAKGKGNSTVKRHRRASKMRQNSATFHEARGSEYAQKANKPDGLRAKIKSDLAYNTAEDVRADSLRKITSKHTGRVAVGKSGMAKAAKAHSKAVDAAIDRAKKPAKRRSTPAAARKRTNKTKSKFD